MTSYDRIYNILTEGAGRSHDAPGHEERMRGHIQRIRSHPEFEEDKPSKSRKASKKTQAAIDRARKRQAEQS